MLEAASCSLRALAGILEITLLIDVNCRHLFLGIASLDFFVFFGFALAGGIGPHTAFVYIHTRPDNQNFMGI
jgi:hypothetical protein